MFSEDVNYHLYLTYGNAGNGGRGGNGEFAGFDKNPTARAGDGGRGGDGGNINIDLSVFGSYVRKIKFTIKIGDIGSGGRGGDGGHSDEYWFIGIRIKWSNHGNGGYGGKKGYGRTALNSATNYEIIRGKEGTDGQRGSDGTQDYY